MLGLLYMCTSCSELPSNNISTVIITIDNCIILYHPWKWTIYRVFHILPHIYKLQIKQPSQNRCTQLQDRNCGSFWGTQYGITILHGRLSPLPIQYGFCGSGEGLEAALSYCTLCLSNPSRVCRRTRIRSHIKRNRFNNPTYWVSQNLPKIWTASA